MRVGITGQAGFIGTHLFNHLGLRECFKRIPFRDEFFDDPAELRSFVHDCDAIVHLAAVNRHPDMQELHDINVRLVSQLIEAMEAEGVTPHVLFSSSTQEDWDNPYGESKRKGRELLAAWAKRNGAVFTGMVIPNVFGPFGEPNYNSVVATFCHKLTHGEEPEILVDGTLKLIYINDLCKEFIRAIEEQNAADEYLVPHGAEKRVSEILELLRKFKSCYQNEHIVPHITSKFVLDLFNTFVCHLDLSTFYPGALVPHADDRGSFVEVLKLDETGGQVSFSTTHPGITRGNHYHTRKFERFAVIKGKARIQLRKIGTDQVLDFELNGEKPAFVDMPVWFTHNIANVGAEDVYTVFWINEFYDPEDPDTFFEEV